MAKVPLRATQFWLRGAAVLTPPAAMLVWPQAYLPIAAITLAAYAWAGMRWLRRLPRRWRYIRPTEKAIREVAGEAGVRLRVYGQIAPRPPAKLSPAEQRLRAMYGARLEPTLRWLPDRAMRAWWAIQRPADRRIDYFRRPDPPRVKLTLRTAYLSPDQRKAISAIIHAKLPLGELTETWDLVGSTVGATWRIKLRPPARAGLADLQAAFPALAEHEYFVGLKVGAKAHTISLDDDAPHIAISAGSGAGKSILAMLLAVQTLARSGRVTILDIKGSHRWALAVPGVRYCHEPAEMHQALIELLALAQRRNREAIHQPDGWDPGRRELIIFEEMNSTVAELRDYWTETRDKSDDKVSPAVKAFRKILQMGRSAKVNVIGIAQMLSANAALGSEARENFGVRVLARYTVNAWRMLVPEAAMPRASRTRGLWQFVVAGRATAVQVAYLTTAQARAFASVTHTQAGSEARLASDVTDDRDIVDTLAALITIQDAIDEGILDCRPDAARQRLHRARKSGGWVPQTHGRRRRADLFRRGDLIEWAARGQGILREDVDA